MLSTKLGFVLFCFVWQNEWETQRGITCYDVMQNPFPFSFQLFFIKNIKGFGRGFKIKCFLKASRRSTCRHNELQRGEVYI